MPRLTLADIADLRAYEREREEFRESIIELKRIRRVEIGPVVSVTFEDARTIRFQVQEMARAEKMTTDKQIQDELDVYNALIPAPGELRGTLFVELTSQEEMRKWLPALVGIERCIELRWGAAVHGGDPDDHVARSLPEESHGEQLTRAAVTPAVHYIGFALEPVQIEALSTGPAVLAVRHPAYDEETVLSAATLAELVRDLRHGG